VGGRLFGCRVPRRSQHLAGGRQAGRASGERARDAEVGQLHAARRRQQDVGGLDIPMSQAPCVRRGEAREHPVDDLDGSILGQSTFGAERVGERHPVDELHDDERDTVVLADVMDGHGVRVLQTGCAARFSQQSLAHRPVADQLVANQLDGHRPVERQIAADDHPSHAGRAQGPTQLLATGQ
jgi:hypothetical protein